MHFSTATISAAAVAVLSSTVSAGNVYVDNLCGFPLYLQSGAAGVQPGPVIKLPANKINAYNEVQRNAQFHNNYISISRTPDMAHPLQMSYTQTTQGPKPGNCYYDLSTVFGDPLRAQGFELIGSGPGYDIKCPPRASGDCPYTYSPSNKNGNGAVFTQGDLDSFAFKLCSSA